MPSIPGSLDRNPIPGITSNPEMAQAIDGNNVFSALAQEVLHDREVSAMRHYFTYEVSGEVQGQVTLPFTLLIEQGSDFKCFAITGSCFSYDAVNASSFPIPNALGVTAWAGRGLSFNMVDTRSGRQLTSGFNAAENILSPGYGQMFQQPFPMRYFFWRNSKLRIDVRNRDNALRIHEFRITFHGFKIYTPE
jgi:hypothetical protein